MDETVLDARGLICPLPVLKAQKRLRAMSAGERLRIDVTDPKAPEDLRLLCDERGYRLLGRREADGVVSVSIEKT
ncbi:MAG: sulfurtransferase TusA family protein [Geminicoccaceae bacterium]|nr:sulfurtransferase TusA family protein [Geminicoccaceae bacterium]